MKLISIHSPAVYWSVLCISILSACASSPDSHVVPGPMGAPPVQRPTNIERINNGSIFQPNMNSVSLFTDERKPRFVGDKVKINISETLSATSTINTDSSRATTLVSQGPGAKAGLGLITSIMNENATAAGGLSLKGGGTTVNNNTFTGLLSATVINVLPNGNLVVAGDRSIALNGDVNVLRFSGIVSPKDIQAGNIVASSDAVNARFEVVGRGELTDNAQRNWLQRVLADTLSAW
jgi:flagellar L-ring protein precursor FlgH